MVIIVIPMLLLLYRFFGIDRLINYVIYATFRMEVLYYATMEKVALLLQKIENREPITVGIGE